MRFDYIGGQLVLFLNDNKVTYVLYYYNNIASVKKNINHNHDKLNKS